MDSDRVRTIEGCGFVISDTNRKHKQAVWYAGECDSCLDLLIAGIQGQDRNYRCPDGTHRATECNSVAPQPSNSQAGCEHKAEYVYRCHKCHKLMNPFQSLANEVEELP